MANTHPSPRARPYNRISASEWERQKPLIQALYVDEDRALKNVIEIMKLEHGFESNERCYKRRLSKWGISKNIPRNDMVAMVEKTNKRLEHEQKKTRFKRRCNDGEFREVSAMKLDAFQKLIGREAISGLSPSSMPSNLIYYTPSNEAGSSTSTSTLNSPGTRDRTKEDDFNHEFERIWSNKSDVDDWKPVARCDQSNSSNNEIQRWLGTYNIHDIHESLDEGHASLFDKNYQASITALELARDGYAYFLGDKHWLTVMAGFEAEMVKLATYHANPRELNQRIRQLVFHQHTLLRQNYIRGLNVPNPAELRKHLVSLKIVSHYWTSILVSQNTLQKWEPILSAQHSNMITIRKRLIEKKAKWQRSIEADIQEPESNGIGAAFTNMMVLGDMKVHQRGASFLDLCDSDSRYSLKQKFEALESNNGSMAHTEIRNAVERLYHARRKMYSGAYYSFLGSLKRAEKYFQRGHEDLELETCPEIKLHRLFWYAEHKTRIQDWEEAKKMLNQAREVFEASRNNSEFISYHFPSRFELLNRSISERISIDITIYRTEVDRLEQLKERGELPASADTPMSTHSEWIYPDQIVDLERSMFSISSSPSGISEEDWRQFIITHPPGLSHSPAGATPMQQPSTPVDTTNDVWLLSPVGLPKGKEKETQPTTVGEASNDPMVLSSDDSPAGEDSPMEWQLEDEQIFPP